jgi:polyphosphate kinase 2 (PPK2 family)
VAWRYWRALPPRGRIGIFMNAWYRQLVDSHVRREVSDAQFDARLQEVRQYEQMLTDEGIVVLKFWIHLSRDAQKQRLHELQSDPKTRWRVTAVDRRRCATTTSITTNGSRCCVRRRSARRRGTSSKAPIPTTAT